MYVKKCLKVNVNQSKLLSITMKDGSFSLLSIEVGMVIKIKFMAMLFEHNLHCIIHLESYFWVKYEKWNK